MEAKSVWQGLLLSKIAAEEIVLLLYSRLWLKRLH